MPRLKSILIILLGWTFGPTLADAQNFSELAQRYQPTAEKIIAYGREHNQAYLKLQELCDDIGCRLSGTESLQQAVQWAQQALIADGQENVRAEPVTVRYWRRGQESCQMLEPRVKQLAMLGLGGSVGTPPEGITAEVIVVGSKQELDSLPDEAIQGKIVVFNVAMPEYSPDRGSGYGETVQYRSSGAKWAGERGAVAVLVRSVTAYSLNSPHTGAMMYGGAANRIPAAAITVEAATQLDRLQKRGKKPVVQLKMEAADLGEAPSANVVGEIVGTAYPDEIVVIGGHLDSWDVGDGAQDDGAGCVSAMEALNILRRLDLHPRRTIRVVLWTNEENGLAGARSYAVRHQNEKHVAGIESDSGGFAPEGLSVEMKDEQQQELAAQQLTQILQLLAPLGATRATQGHSGADIGQLKQFGGACLGLNVDGRLYFNTHHTDADTVDKVNPRELGDCAVTLAVTAFVLADLPQPLGVPMADTSAVQDRPSGRAAATKDRGH